LTAVLVAGVLSAAGCGGGSGDNASTSVASAQRPQTPQSQSDALAVAQCGGPNQPYNDPVAYRNGQNDGIDVSQVVEKAAIMHYTWTSPTGPQVHYTTTTGHLTASDPTGKPEATMSYVAFTAPSTDGRPRPVTFFLSSRVGWSSTWLRLGSFAPTRVAVPIPSFTNWPNFPTVNNNESLIDTTDMVFIDTPGTGLSEAILPNTNQSFWSTDADSNVIRDFIRRYVTVNHRQAAPLYLYGESYGAARANIVAASLQSAGSPVAGVVLQSPVLNVLSDSTLAFSTIRAQTNLKFSTDTVAGYFPSYAEVAGYFNLAGTPPVDPGALAQQVESFVTSDYQQFQPYAQTWTLTQGNFTGPSPAYPDPQTLSNWAQQSGLTSQAMTGYFNANPFTTQLIPGTTIGKYDGRISLPNSDPRLAGDPDPSDILVSSPFLFAGGNQMYSYLGYNASKAPYILFDTQVGASWNYSHAGQPLPDTIPDLLTALTQNPRLKVLAETGYYDLAEPFFNTETQLSRLQSALTGQKAYVWVNFFPGGQMIYLDDVARPQMKAGLQDFYKSVGIPNALRLIDLPPPWPDEPPASTPTAAAATNVAALMH
jgi:carboxypeptidase C (cathepsin A)